MVGESLRMIGWPGLLKKTKLKLRKKTVEVPNSEDIDDKQLPPSPEPRLPGEILCCILDEVGLEDHQTLTTCSFVSHFFRDACCKQLYNLFIIDSPEECKQLLTMIQGPLSIVSYITSLQVVDDPGLDAGWSLPNVCLPRVLNIIGAHGRLRSLSFTIHSRIIWRQEHKPYNTILRLYDLIPRINSPLYNALKRLRKDKNPEIEPQDKACVLHTLEIGGPDAMRVVEFLKGPFCAIDITKLQKLVKCGEDAGSKDAVDEVIMTAKESLEEITERPDPMVQTISQIVEVPGLGGINITLAISPPTVER